MNSLSNNTFIKTIVGVRYENVKMQNAKEKESMLGMEDTNKHVIFTVKHTGKQVTDKNIQDLETNNYGAQELTTSFKDIAKDKYDDYIYTTMVPFTHINRRNPWADEDDLESKCIKGCRQKN